MSKLQGVENGLKSSEYITKQNWTNPSQIVTFLSEDLLLASLALSWKG